MSLESVATNVWYSDSGASCHMTRVKEYFTNLKESNFYIELGDDANYHPIGISTVKFQRESDKPLLVEDVLYVPERLGDNQQVPKSPMESPTVWGHFLRVQKSPKHRDASYLQNVGFTKSEADPNLYYIQVKGKPLILALHVDELFLTRSEDLIAHYKRDLAKEFKMKDFGLMQRFLGLEMWQREGEIFLGQGEYAVKILRHFRIRNNKPVATPLVTN
eukprot:PITA_01680